MTGLKLCPTCDSDHVIPTRAVTSDLFDGWRCDWCGAEWPMTIEEMIAADPAPLLEDAARDPIRGGYIE